MQHIYKKRKGKWQLNLKRNKLQGNFKLLHKEYI